MSIFLVVTPADVFSSDQIVATDEGGLGFLSRSSWRVTLLDQDREDYAFGEPGEVLAELGLFPAVCRTTGDPEWDEVLGRVEVAGFSAVETYRDPVVPGGLWLRMGYRAPRAGATLDELWDGELTEA